MTAASGLDYAAPRPPRRFRGLDPLPGEPPGLTFADRVILNIVARVGTLPPRTQTEVWSAVSGCAAGMRSAARWDRLAEAHAARQRAAAARLAEPRRGPLPAVAGAC